MAIPGDESSTGSVNLVKLLMVREKSILYQKSFSTADTVVNAVRGLFENLDREMVVVVGLDNSNFPTVIYQVSVGSVNQSSVCMASIFKPLLLSNAISFILCHNHPAGLMRASNADIELTAKIGDVAKILELHLLDHIILNSDCSEYFSFRKMGLLKD